MQTVILSLSHTGADVGYCSNTLVNVSCGLDLPVHGDEVHSIRCEYGCSTIIVSM